MLSTTFKDSLMLKALLQIALVSFPLMAAANDYQFNFRVSGSVYLSGNSSEGGDVASGGEVSPESPTGPVDPALSGMEASSMDIAIYIPDHEYGGYATLLSITVVDVNNTSTAFNIEDREIEIEGSGYYGMGGWVFGYFSSTPSISFNLPSTYQINRIVFEVNDMTQSETSFTFNVRNDEGGHYINSVTRPETSSDGKYVMTLESSDFFDASDMMPSIPEM